MSNTSQLLDDWECTNIRWAYEYKYHYTYLNGGLQSKTRLQKKNTYYTYEAVLAEGVTPETFTEWPSSYTGSITEQEVGKGKSEPLSLKARMVTMTEGAWS